MALAPQQPADDLALRRDLVHAFHPATPAAGLLRQHVVPRRLAVHDLAAPRDAESLGGRPVRLHLRHSLYPCSVVAAICFLAGAITITMFLPSCFGAESTTATPSRSATRRSRIRRPSSVCAISRPRNMIVILTRDPALRNRSTCPFFVL